MLRIGEYNTLKVVKEVEFGLYLRADDEEILLPAKYVPQGTKLGDELNVFVYTDSEDRLIATTLKPKATVGEFAALEVVDVADFGAFLDMGLEKDLLVPKKEQRGRMQKGEIRVVRVYRDKQTERMVATLKLEPFLKKAGRFLKKSQKVEVLVYDRSDLGFSVIVNGQFQGMVFQNDVYGKLAIGSETTGYIKNIRPDGKLDIALKPLGKGALEEHRNTVLDALQKAGGALPFNYKSSPEAINDTFGMSRKAFKSALTSLIDEGLIIVDETGMRLKG
jgi:predicted RNA-binding protein (virulence factor B family)